VEPPGLAVLASLLEEDNARRHGAQPVRVVAADQLEDRVVPKEEPDPEYEENQDVERVDRVANDAWEQVPFQEAVERVLIGEVDLILGICLFLAAG
jgi:hypothetical protein